MTSLVAFMGPKGHGKTTAAGALEAYGYHHVNFATPLKASCKIIFGLTDDELENPVLKERVLDRWPFLTPRHIMQQVGSELYRAWLPETWTQAFFRVASEHLERDECVVLSDLRFVNEAEVIRNLGGIIIKVVDPRKEMPSESSHVSETEASRILADFVIRNSGTIDDLHAKVCQIVEASF